MAKIKPKGVAKADGWLKASRKHSENCAAKRTDIPCVNCGATMSTRQSLLDRKKYCSKSCMFKYRAKQSLVAKSSDDLTITRGQKPRKGIVHICICGTKIYRSPHHSKKFKVAYCSRECTGKALIKGKPLNCEQCGKEYYASPGQIKWRGSRNCSVPCRGQAQSERQKGENNPWWRGGVSPENRRIRYSARMGRWRKAVFERDNYTCQECHVRGGYLQADHIKQFAYYPELRFELSNGRTLCRDCHRATPTWGRRLNA